MQTQTNAAPEAPCAHVSPALAKFDYLPNSALVDGRTVAQVLCCSYQHVFRLSREGRLAKPLKTGPCSTRWQVGAIRAYLESLKHPAAA